MHFYLLLAVWRRNLHNDLDEHAVLWLLFFDDNGLVFLLLLFSLNWMVVYQHGCHFLYVPLGIGLALCFSGLGSV